MDAPLPRSRLRLNLLIGEAKRRMRRRRVLVAFAAAGATAALVLAVHPPWGGGAGALGVAGNGGAIAEIPGMTRVAAFPEGVAMSSCNGPIGPGGHYPHYCSVLKPRDGRYERWVLTSAHEEGFRWGVKIAFAKSHPAEATGETTGKRRCNGSGIFVLLDRRLDSRQCRRGRGWAHV